MNSSPMANYPRPQRLQEHPIHDLQPFQHHDDSVARSTFIREFTKAKRSKALFMLDSHARGFVYLALRLKVRFESFDLVRAAVSVLKKLKELGDETYLRLMRGMKLAWAYSAAAGIWGNPEAKAWRSDMNFVDFLGRFSQGCLVR